MSTDPVTKAIGSRTDTISPTGGADEKHPRFRQGGACGCRPRGRGAGRGTDALGLGRKTILTPKTATLDALAAEGVTVDVAPDASLGNKGIKFPITGGRLSLDNLNGKIKHSGGLTFTGNGVTLTLGDFIVKTGRKNVLRASIDGTDAKIRLAVLNLNRSRLRTRGGRAVVSNVKVLVARRAGRALAATFGISNYTDAKLGTAEIKITQ